jgi:hypothetical protein
VRDVKKQGKHREGVVMHACTREEDIHRMCSHEHGVWNPNVSACERKSSDGTDEWNPWCASARLVRDALAEEDGAVQSGEQDPNLVSMLAHQEREAPGQAGIGLHLSVPKNFSEARLSSSGNSGVRR